jgi:ribosomal protein L7/L12
MAHVKQEQLLTHVLHTAILYLSTLINIIHRINKVPALKMVVLPSGKDINDPKPSEERNFQSYLSKCTS